MTTTANYTYHRKDGGTTLCYGKVLEDSNFSLACDDEYNDGIVADYEGPATWRAVCAYLEKNYDTQIEQIEAV
jgi:hypothetical protein